MQSYIKAISFYLPGQSFSNIDLQKEFPDWSSEKVETKIGIRERRIIGDSESVSDMAIAAAELLFKEHSVSKDDIDYVLLCTQSPDYFLPATSCIVQEKLGLPTSVGALDFNQGCSGFVYGLSLAKGLVSSLIAKNVLLITAESYSKYIHPSDKGNRSIFGDAASAILISSIGNFRIENFVLGTDGRGAANLIVKNGAGRFPCKTGVVNFDENGSVVSDDYLYMRGSEIFNFTMEAVPSLVYETLEKNKISLDAINYFIFHQANSLMLEHLRKKIGIPRERFIIDMENFGNTVSSTIPIALNRLLKSRDLDHGTRILLVGFGVGYSWGGTMLTVS